MNERRKSKRIELESKLLIKSLNSTEDPHEVGIEVVDVSKTGVGFTCEKPLMIGTVYEAYLTIWTKEVLHAFLEIIRIEKNAEGYTYGAIFIGMPEMDASRISLYDTVTEELKRQEK